MYVRIVYAHTGGMNRQMISRYPKYDITWDNLDRYHWSNKIPSHFRCLFLSLCASSHHRTSEYCNRIKRHAAKEWGIREGNEKFLLNYGFIMSRLVCQIETKDRESHLVHDALILPEAKFFASTQCFPFHRSTRRTSQVHSLPCTVRAKVNWIEAERMQFHTLKMNKFIRNSSLFLFLSIGCSFRKNQRIESFFYMKFWRARHAFAKRKWGGKKQIAWQKKLISVVSIST